jgi:site-specific DNA-cytosine methylase
MKALGVYIFAGGFTLGVRQHFDVVAHWEDGPFGVATCLKNKLVTEVHTEPDAWPVDDTRFYGLDLLYGNPPCAPWSAAGSLPNQKVRLQNAGVTAKYDIDPRVECVRKQFALLEKLQPRIWIWESVARAYTVGKPFVDSLRDAAIAQGYAVTLLRVDGAWCGLPQRRRRFFFIAHKVEIPLSHPGLQPPTIGQVLDFYAANGVDLSEEHPLAKARVTGNSVNIINGMKPGEGGQERFERWLRETGKTQELNELGRVKGRPNFLMHRLAREKVCGTIVSGTCLVHPDHDRFLTVRETQVLSSYPHDYEFVGRDAYGQISKAVLPRVGEWLARKCREGLEANEVAPATVRDINYLKPQ